MVRHWSVGIDTDDVDQAHPLMEGVQAAGFTLLPIARYFRLDETAGT